MFTLLFITMSCLTTCQDINTNTSVIPQTFKTEAACKKSGELIKLKFKEMSESQAFVQPTRVSFDFVCTQA
jgi:hypothetical protein